MGSCKILTIKSKLILLAISGFLTLYACDNPWMASLFEDEEEPGEQKILTLFYAVTFNTDGGSIIPSQIVANGGVATRPNNPTKDGLGFVNWYSDPDLADLYNFNTPVTHDITLYAKWGTPYTVTFNSDGGTSVTDQIVGEGGMARRPANPTREGYAFDNWYSNIGLTTLFDFNTSITSNITVYAKWNEVPVSGVTLNRTTLSLSGSGATFTLTATVAPSNALNKNVTWSSSNNDVATVSNSGEVIAVNGGTAIITATSAADSSKTSSCTVTVNIPVTGVTLDKPTLTLTGSGITDTLTPMFAPANATNKNVTWSTSAPGVATVNNGLVSSVGVGTATITVRTADGGHTATCTVTVNPVLVTGVTLNTNTIALNKGGTETLTATLAPANATTKTVTWSSSAAGVATVNSNGLVTAVGGGSATITVRTNDGSFEAICNVTVTVPVTGVTLNRTALPLNKGGTETLIATVAPSDATNKNVTWASGTPSVATVNSATGEVTAVAGGTAIITVTTVGLRADGQPATATCTVTVNVPATGVTLDKTTLALRVGGSTETLTPTVAPSDALNKNVTWSISPSGIATVNNGVVTAVAPGSATITVRTADGGHTATCIVTVTQPVTGVTLNKTSTTINVGGTETLSATVAPNNASDKTVSWSTSAPGVATVNNGVVTAVSAGKANITVTTADGNHTASCEVTVTVYITINITVNQIEDGTPNISIPQSEATISKSGANKTLVLNVPAGYTNYEWRIDGVGAGTAVTGSGPSFTVNTENTNYNSVGKHIVYLVAWKGTVPYSKAIEFWITE